MRGEIMLKILENLKNASLETGDFLSAFLTDYHTSYKMLRGIQPYPRRPERKKYDYEAEVREREMEEKHKFYIIVSKLRKQGLVQRTKRRKTVIWRITALGKEKIADLKDRMRRALPPKEMYRPEKTNEWKIVIFDIPEREKRKREWLRRALTHLGLKQLQKSVWIGKIVLPENFLTDLKNLHMLDYVEIFAITKGGSIKQIE